MTLPDSVGTVTLTSPDPRPAPRIDLNFLAEPRDGRRLLEGVKLSRTIGRTAPLRDCLEIELSPGPSVHGDPALLAAINAGLDAYHPLPPRW